MLMGILIFILASLSQSWALYLMAYLLITGNVLKEIFHNLCRGIVFDENFLMLIATLGAFWIGDYVEAIAVMLLYEIGELFQDYAVSSSRRSISGLVDIRSDTAHVVRGSSTQTLPVEAVLVGEEIVVRPGERIPLDGIVRSGESYLDTSALTGESNLRFMAVGDRCWSGCINTNALLKLEVTSTAADSTVARILELVENAASKKASTEKFITRFARTYTPMVVGFALLLAIVPPLLMGADFSDWVYRSLVFLLASCPCALVLSIPLGFFAGIGGASKQGILVKGANYLEILEQAHTVVFDKTGTLTKGNFVVHEIHPIGISEASFLELAAYGESISNHPIAKSIVAAYGGDICEEELSEFEEIAGKGISIGVGGHRVMVGNASLMEHFQVEAGVVSAVGTVIYLAVDGIYRGYMLIGDEIKDSSKSAIARLKSLGVERVVMLTGDNWAVAEQVATELGVDVVLAELLPHEKVAEVEALLATVPPKKRLIFVGDGMNDAPVLARADIGVAMGGIGSDAAIEAADLVLMQDDPMALVAAILKSRHVNRLLKQNIVFAIGAKIIIMLLSIMGLTTMWIAVFGDVGIAILAILNSIRALSNH